MSDRPIQTGEADQISLNCPRSLRRLGPSLLVIESASGSNSPRITGSGVHLYAHSKYVLRIVTPQIDPGDNVSVEKKLDGCDFIRGFETHTENHLPDGKKEYKIVFTVSSLIWPLPVRSTLSIPIHHSALGTVSQSVSLVVWPTWKNQLVWMLTVLVFLPPVWSFVLNLLKDMLLDENGQLRSTIDLVHQTRSMWLSLVLPIGGLFLACPIGRLIGWIYLLVLSLFD